MKISNRLQLIASFVDDNTNVIDVGCDHALLDIFLALNKKNIDVIASDIKKGPLERARKNIEDYNLENRIEIKLGAGIKTMTPKTDTIIITGLGGKTIIEILKDDLDKLTNVKTLIVSPHSNVYEVRQEVTSFGFKIIDEIFLYDQNKPYVIIKFVRGEDKYTDEELFFGPIILKNKNSHFYKYCRRLRKKNNLLLDKVSQKEVRDELQKEIERLDKILNV